MIAPSRRIQIVAKHRFDRLSWTSVLVSTHYRAIKSVWPWIWVRPAPCAHDARTPT
jgi:hypothetical protein